MDVGGDDIPQLEHSVQYLAAVKATLPPEDYRNFIDIIDTFRKQGCDYNWLRDNVKEFLKDFRFLTRAFNVFLPNAYRIEVPAAKSASVDLPNACRFLHKIKVSADSAKRHLTGSNQILDSFLHIIQNFGNNGKSIVEIYREVAFLLHNDPELLEEFTQFLPDGLKPTASVSSSSEWKSLVQLMSSAVEETKELSESVWTTELLLTCYKVKQQLNARDYKKFLYFLKSYINGKFSSHDLQYLVGNMLVHNPALIEELSDFAAAGRFVKCQKPRSKRGTNGKFIREGTGCDDSPLKDLNFSQCFSCTPSYRLLPESYLNHEASNKREVEKQVLENCWVSIDSRSKNSSDARKSNNPYADKLFKCEDEMHEMDLLLENGASVITRIKILLRKINDPHGNIKIPIRLEDHFRAMNIRCILLVYGNKGVEVLEALKQNPRNSLPLLLDRMNKQRQEWVDQRKKYLKIWSEVIQENYHKSLDPQRFTKKQDINKINSKAIVVGSKEFTDKETLYSAMRNKKSCLRGETSTTGNILSKRPVSEEGFEALTSVNPAKKWARRTFFSG